MTVVFYNGFLGLKEVYMDLLTVISRKMNQMRLFLISLF